MQQTMATGRVTLLEVREQVILEQIDQLQQQLEKTRRDLEEARKETQGCAAEGSAAPAAKTKPGKTKAWKALNDKERAAATRLGFDKTKWDRSASTPTLTLPWGSLGTREREAAECLGYNQKQWDGELQSTPPPTPPPKMLDTKASGASIPSAMNAAPPAARTLVLETGAHGAQKNHKVAPEAPALSPAAAAKLERVTAQVLLGSARPVVAPPGLPTPPPGLPVSSSAPAPSAGAMAGGTHASSPATAVDGTRAAPAAAVAAPTAAVATPTAAVATPAAAVAAPPAADVAAAAHTPGHEKLWEELCAAERAAAVSLGYSEHMWQEGISPDVCLRPWRELSKSQLDAAVQLGYDEELWEEELAHEDPITISLQ